VPSSQLFGAAICTIALGVPSVTWTFTQKLRLVLAMCRLAKQTA
jgi:hypothetical protein